MYFQHLWYRFINGNTGPSHSLHRSLGCRHMLLQYVVLPSGANPLTDGERRRNEHEVGGMESCSGLNRHNGRRQRNNAGAAVWSGSALLISDAIQLEKLTRLTMTGWAACQSCKSGVGGGSLCPREAWGHSRSPEQSEQLSRAKPALRVSTFLLTSRAHSVASSRASCLWSQKRELSPLVCWWVVRRLLFELGRCSWCWKRQEMRRRTLSVAGFLLAWKLGQLLRYVQVTHTHARTHCGQRFDNDAKVCFSVFLCVFARS